MEHFPVFVWRQDFQDEAMPDKLLRAFGGVNVEGTDAATWARSKQLDFYVGHAPGRNELHIDEDRDSYLAIWQEYWKEREPDVLVREPCLSDPKTLLALKQQLALTLEQREGEHGWGISLGDEVGLTPYGAPLDLCESDFCRAGFQRFLKENHRWSFLHEEDDTELPYPTTDDTRLAWIDGDPQHVGAWLARRAYHHSVVHDVLRQLAEHSRKLSSSTRVGLFGQSGRSAFGDVGVEEVFSSLDFLEVYRWLDSRELLYTRRESGQRSYLTIFPDDAARHAPAWVAWEHWLRGGDGLVLWSDRELLKRPQYFERMENVVSSIRTLRYLLPDWAPQPASVAVLHSPDSMALSWLRDALHDGPTWMKRYTKYHTQHGTREVSLRASLRLLEDCGALPGAVPLNEVDGKTPERFPLLIANQLILLQGRGELRLRLHLKSGGRLLVIGTFAEYDTRGVRREGDLLADLKAEFPGAVTSFSLDGSRYLTQRLTGDTYVRARRVAMRAKLTGESRLSWTIRTAGDEAPGSNSPWLRAQVFDSNDGSWTCAALPNHATKLEQQSLKDRVVHLETGMPWEIDWLHPPQAIGQGSAPIQIPAGEPIVFRLRPKPQ